MAPRRRCPTCGSKQWHKEPSSGLIACSEGHVLQDYRNETTEITEVGPHAMKKRTLKSNRKKREDVSKADPKFYHGARARYHYFLCLQHLLRTQVAALTQLWELPPEFAVICRDIWALHLSLLSSPPPAEPYYHAQEMREAGPKEGDNRLSADAVKSEAESSQPKAANDAAGSATENETGKRKNKVESDESDEEDSEIEALLREDSEISTSSSSEGEKATPTSKAHKKGKRRGHATEESPVATIGVLVVACWTLRIPVMLRDFTRLIESYELPYLDPTIRVLPPSMVQHLTKQNVQALSPRHAPTTLGIHAAASRMGKRLFKTYGVYTPECNAASLLWRLTQEMAGSPILYRMAKRTGNVLTVPLTLHRSLSREEGERGRHRYENVPPEVGLVACIIIVLKLVYGLDGQARVPTGAEDIGCAMPEWSEYVCEMKKMEEEDLGEKATRFSAKHHLGVGDMDESELDSYINFCEKALVDYAKDTEGGVKRYFGRMTTRGRGAEEGARGDRRALRGRECEVGGLRAGAEYKIWNARDVDGSAAVEYESVLGRGVRVCGVGRERLGATVNEYERRLVQWVAVQRRRGRGRRE